MFWNSISIAPVLDEAGRTTHFIGVQNDITEVKTLLRESIHSNALYRALMGAAELVIGAHTEHQLLDGLCHLLVDSQLFSQVSIGRPGVRRQLASRIRLQPRWRIQGCRSLTQRLHAATRRRNWLCGLGGLASFKSPNGHRADTTSQSIRYSRSARIFHRLTRLFLCIAAGKFGHF